MPIQTQCESPIASEYDDDEEDGITLSPTFSVVSGLTLPTCLGSVNGDAAPLVSIQSDVFENLSPKEGSLFHERMSPIARHRHRKQQEKSALSTGAKLSKHPYLQRVHSKQSRASSVEAPNNNNVNSTDRLHEIATPKAKGGPVLDQANTMLSRREQLISRVRASPRHNTSFPQHSTHSGNAKPPNPPKYGSQEWQERNAIAEHDISQSFQSDKSPARHFDGRNGFPPAKPKGKVAESVDRVNRTTKQSQRHSSNNNHQNMSRQNRGRSRNHGDPRNEDKVNSLATPDCIRID